ncbi:DNA/RNA non-specific endonuclease [uncultured Sphingomonas sp.]|uniref:DNA/RNA non-specific endonuclease n=1 Tax=uncultured Sphingomonas sp. TaxID=158754 RepID=UPI0035C9FC19
MAIGMISAVLASSARPAPPPEPPAKVAAALIAASRGPSGLDTGKLAARVAALDPRDPATAPVRAAVNAALTPVDRGRLAAALDRATADVSVRLKDGGVVVADRDASSANAKTLAAYRDSADPKERAVFRSVIATYGSIPAAEAALFGPRPAQVASIATPSIQPFPTPRPTPPTLAAGPANQEGVGAFFEGALAGDLSDNSSWSKVGGQVAMGFVPIAGQIADLRDIGANIHNIGEGKPGGWFGLGTAMIGIVPGVGDAAKAALRGGGKVAEAGAEVAEQVAKHGDEATGGAARGADEAGALVTRTATVGRNVAEWKVDAQGRPTSVTATLSELQPKGTARGTDELSAQDAVRGRGIADDDAGHVIGHRFMGDQGAGNMFPQNFNFNRSAYKTMENEWAGWIEHGGTVKTRVELSGGTPNRPAEVAVSYEVFDASGRQVFDKVHAFENASDQKFSRLSTLEIKQRMGQ